MSIRICNDFGEVELTADVIDAIRIIQACAWELQITEGEFMSEFANGIPECPECKNGEAH